jgi:hypothetical protein
LLNIYSTKKENNLEKEVVEKEGRVRLPFGLIKHHTLKTYRGLEIHNSILLSSALYGNEWSASLP